MFLERARGRERRGQSIRSNLARRDAVQYGAVRTRARAHTHTGEEREREKGGGIKRTWNESHRTNVCADILFWKWLMKEEKRRARQSGAEPN
jgi:hypothetical protein